MKKILIIIALAALFVSCQKENEVVPPPDPVANISY